MNPGQDVVLTWVVSLVITFIITMILIVPRIVKQRHFYSNMYGRSFNIPYEQCNKIIEGYLIKTNTKYTKYSTTGQLSTLPIKCYEYYFLQDEGLYIGLPIYIDCRSFVVIGEVVVSSEKRVNKYQESFDRLMETDN